MHLSKHRNHTGDSIPMNMLVDYYTHKREHEVGRGHVGENMMGVRGEIGVDMIMLRSIHI